MGTFSFPKSERLYKKKDIQELFDKGSSFYLYPFKVIIQKPADLDTNQVLFSVSKKNFKKAVDRNLIKRRMREAYRLNKAALPQTSKLQMAYIYTAKDILEFDKIRDKMVASFKRLGEDEIGNSKTRTKAE
jgi:ribonuclease P protein component